MVATGVVVAAAHSSEPQPDPLAAAAAALVASSPQQHSHRRTLPNTASAQQQRQQQNARSSSSSSSFSLGRYFFTVLFLFGVGSIILNGRSLPLVQEELQSLSSLGVVTSLENFVLDKNSVTPSLPTEAEQQQQQQQSTHAALLLGRNAGSEPANVVSSFDRKKDTRTTTQKESALAGLRCDDFGGPSRELAQEMVYWQDIPADAYHVSPFRRRRSSSSSNSNHHHPQVPPGAAAVAAAPKYLTFEPDSGGWNNIRMAFESAIGLAFAMGRTLVLPPEKTLYLLGDHGRSKKDGTSQRRSFTFAHFFHTDDIDKEHAGVDIITMEEFLKREALGGHFHDQQHGGKVVFPTQNRTNWDGNPEPIFLWLRQYATSIVWNQCLAAFPASLDPKDMQTLRDMEQTIQSQNIRWQDYVDHPVPVNGTSFDRLKENLNNRKKLCLYEPELQEARVLHIPGSGLPGHRAEMRLLIHFYAFLYFQDWNHDLWLKRFVRDHIRYADEIQCAAARVVAAVRKHARQRDPAGNPQGIFDALHVRRGDFQYTDTRIPADQIYAQTSKVLAENATVFIATDERDKKFFHILQQHYDVVFLDDFMTELGDVNTNFFGMVDALIASRSRNFFGCWFSTFTGYINRIRGYHADKDKAPGYERGVISSWYYVHEDKFDNMRQYYPLKPALWTREFPTSWRLLNTGMEEFHKRQGYLAQQ